MRIVLPGLLCAMLWAVPATAQKAAQSSAALGWETLAGALPDSVTGFVAGEATGGIRAAAGPNDSARGSQISSARRSYVRETPEGEQSFIAVTIADAGRSTIALESLLPVLDYMQSESGEESIEVEGRRATQIIEYGDADIALGIIYVRLGTRMVVIVQGEGVRDVAELQQVAGLVNYDALERVAGITRK